MLVLGVPPCCRAGSGYPLVFLTVSWAVTSCSVASVGRPSPAVPAIHSPATHITPIPHAGNWLRVTGCLRFAVYANGRLSPPFAVYATSTPCYSLFRLEDYWRLSSINLNSFLLLKFRGATIPEVQDSHIHYKASDKVPILILEIPESNYVLDHRNEGSNGYEKEK